MDLTRPEGHMDLCVAWLDHQQRADLGLVLAEYQVGGGAGAFGEFLHHRPRDHAQILFDRVGEEDRTRAQGDAPGVVTAVCFQGADQPVRDGPVHAEGVGEIGDRQPAGMPGQGLQNLESVVGPAMSDRPAYPGVVLVTGIGALAAEIVAAGGSIVNISSIAGPIGYFSPAIPPADGASSTTYGLTP